jgi:diguanylate cyclase (GGDEF)-like protein
MSETLLSRSSSLFSTASSLSSTQFQCDNLVSHFVEEAASPTTLAALSVGGLAYRLGRVGVLGLNAGAYCNTPLRLASIALGLGSEVTAFELTNRALQTFRAIGRSPLQYQSPNLWSWSGPGGWREGLISSLVTFGMLRGAGFLAREQNIAFQHLLQSGAMVGGHQAIGLLGIVPRPEGTLTEQFLHAEATNLQMSAGAGLVHSLAPGIHAFERGLDLSLTNHGAGISFERPLHRFQSRSALSAVGETQGESQRPFEEEPLERSNHVMMAKGRGNESDSSKKPASLATLLRQVRLFREVKPVKLALRALYIGTTGPLRDEILSTLEEIEGGGAHGLLIGDLLSDPRLSQTRFLSSDLQARLTEQIVNLKGGVTSRDSAVFFSNLTRGVLDPLTPSKLPRKPAKLTAEAMLPLLEMRLQELEKLLASKETPPFSAREALAEGVQVAKDYAKVVRGSMKQKDRDFLTQLRNRNDLDRIAERLEHRLVQFMKYSEGPKLEDCVLMVDIDHFKRVNDTYGHSGGDDVLREVAQILRDPETIRLRDIIVRYGGEEFLIFLFKAGRDGAGIAAERIRKIIEEHPIEIEDEGSEEGENKRDPIHVTVSIGVAEMRTLPPATKGGTPVIEGALNHAIKRADMALFAAKSVGRNRVIFSGDPNFDWATGMLSREGLNHYTPQMESHLLESGGSAKDPNLQPWVLKLDLDHLGVINFAHGESTGNKVLWAVAQTLRENATRVNYIPGREGDDEFFIFLPSADREGVLQFAKNIRENLAQREISVDGQRTIHASVSMGAAPLRALPPIEEGGEPRVEGSLQNAIDRATRALGEAKKAGRKQIILSSE